MHDFTISCTVNGETIKRTISPTMTLAGFLREVLGLTGTKIGCNLGRCGSCTVLLDGKPVNSCIVLAPQAHGHAIVTIEGLAKNGILNDLQQTFIDEGAVQCGYCTPGMIISAEYLLRTVPLPTEEEIKNAIAGNLCRCTGYVKIIHAIQKASEKRHSPD